MTVDEFYRQEMKEKPYNKSCLFGVREVDWDWRGRPKDTCVFSKDELKAFAEGYYQMKIMNSK